MGIIFVMLTGGIDLSVGWIVATVGITSGYLVCFSEVPLFLILIIALLEGFALGLVNGLIAAKLKLFPLIITLATSSVFEGIAKLIKGSKDFSDLASHRAGIRWVADTKFLSLPVDFWIAALLVVIVWLVLNKTRFGRNVLAVGGNKECARLSGINVDFITCVCFGLAGFFAAFAAIDVLAQNNAATIESLNSGLEFTCLTADIVGGISMMGGKGNVVGMVVGILIMQVIASGMQFAHWDSNAQKIMKGFILLFAVAFDAVKNWPKVKIRVEKASRGIAKLKGGTVTK